MKPSAESNHFYHASNICTSTPCTHVDVRNTDGALLTATRMHKRLKPSLRERWKALKSPNALAARRLIARRDSRSRKEATRPRVLRLPTPISHTLETYAVPVPRSPRLHVAHDLKRAAPLARDHSRGRDFFLLPLPGRAERTLEIPRERGGRGEGAGRGEGTGQLSLKVGANRPCACRSARIKERADTARARVGAAARGAAQRGAASTYARLPSH